MNKLIRIKTKKEKGKKTQKNIKFIEHNRGMECLRNSQRPQQI